MGKGIHVVDSVFSAGSLTATAGTFDVSDTGTGTSTLKGNTDTAMSLSGTVTLKNGAVLTNSNVSNGSLVVGTHEEESVQVPDEVTFSGTNVFSGTELSNSGEVIVQNAGSLTLGDITNETAASTITVNHSSLGAGTVTNTADGTITVQNGSSFSATTVTNTADGTGKGIHVVDSVFAADSLNTTGGTFDVAGTGSGISTLKGKTTETAMTLFGTVNLLDGAVLTNSNVSNGFLVVGNAAEVTFSGTNVFSGTALSNSGSISLTNASLTTGAITNGASITIDAGSRITATSIINDGGTISFVYNDKNLDCLSAVGGAPLAITGGDIYIDVTDCNFEGSTKTFNSFTFTGNTSDVHLTVNGDPVASSIMSASVENGHIVLTKGTQRNVLFVNADWTSESLPGSISYGDTYDLYFGVNAFNDINKAIEAAAKNDTIVFYRPTGNSVPGNSNTSFDFLDQGTMVIDKDLNFKVSVNLKKITVKID